jgi:RNA polymerase sigma-70 factor (ECF subfamily)
VRKNQIDRRARAKLGLEADYCPGPAEDVELRLEAEELAPDVMLAFESLSEKQQTAVRMRVVDDLSYEEIATRTNSTNQASRLHVSRGLRRLRELVLAAREETQ